TIPHVHHFEEIDMTELLEFRKEMDVDVSVAAFFIKAITIALKDFPLFNAKLDEENGEIQLEKSIHIGIATDTEEGLYLSVIKNANKISMSSIHKEMNELMKNEQKNKLTL